MSDLFASRRTILKYGAASLALAHTPLWAAETTTDVLILGAGMSGLHAARMLQAAGLKVVVVEGSNRIGGRCWTAHDIPGRPELGAAQIGHSYGRVRGNAAELGVELVGPLPGAGSETNLPKVSVSIDGNPVSSEPWPTSPLNRLSPAEKSLSPLQLYSHYINDQPPVVELTDWLKPELAHIDKMSLRQYFTSKGASPEALRLMNVTIPARNLDDANALDFMRKNYYYNWEARGGPYSVVRDGTSALTDAMAASLTNPVRLNKIVSHIQTDANQVRVTCKDGSKYKARICITTIPLSVMKDIRIDGSVPVQQREAWRSIRYNNLVQVFMNVSTPFWDRDGLPPTLWSDGPIEQVFHRPSKTATHGVLLAYINGDATMQLNRMTPAALGAFVIKELARIRPATMGAVSIAGIHNWSTYPFAKGHIAYYAPGDIARYADILAQPAGALYFAGEHCGKIHAGIEAACESAEAAVIKILDDLDKT